MSEALKPCPFCGGPEIPPAQIYCDTCKTNIAGLGDHWNTRPIEDALRARIAELEAALAEARKDTARLEKIIAYQEREHKVLFGDARMGWLFGDDGEVLSGCHSEDDYRFSTLREAIDAIKDAPKNWLRDMAAKEDGYVSVGGLVTDIEEREKNGNDSKG